ncbi:hypothetical protein OQA88_1627 [Cercophora sp. LCS_1]
MRLLNTATRKLETFTGSEVPLYAVFSHRWTSREVAFHDLERVSVCCWDHNDSFVKLRNLCSIAAADGLDYVWIDTCCIDKTNSTEFSAAINSMHRWYRESVICYAYLADVPVRGFARSEWFERGWTLQELLAPSTVVFLNKDWEIIGTKSSLRKLISERTGIPVNVLLSGKLGEVSAAQKMSWAADRVTSVVEDRAYCLMGLFGVYMPMIYGEGERAFVRLQQEILKITDDLSLFAWKQDGPEEPGGLLAASPAAFRHSGNIKRPRSSTAPSVVVNNRGLHLTLPIITIGGKDPLALVHSGEDGNDIGVWLKPLSPAGDYFERKTVTNFFVIRRDGGRLVGEEERGERRICVRQNHQHGECRSLLWRVAARGRAKTMTLLLSEGFEINARDDDGRTPLSWAVEHGSRDMMELLLAKGAELELRDNSGVTPLLRAAMAGNVAMLELLLDAGADLEARDLDGNSALSQAVLNDHAEVVKLLLDKGEDPEAVDSKSRTPLALAAAWGHQAMVKLLLDRGCEKEAVDHCGLTPLSQAARNGCKETVTSLIDAGVNMESKDRTGWTALRWARGKGHRDVVDVLLDRGAVDMDMDGFKLMGRLLLTDGTSGAHNTTEDRFKIRRASTYPLL